jgi:outer membrane protein assembly factor BamD
MHRSPLPWRLAAGLIVCAVACRPEFQLKKFTNNEALYEASLRQFNRHKWGDAIAGFEKLTLDLSPRDSLLPRAYWYLGQAYQGNRDYLLAANAFNRIVESFPDDSLADRSALEGARSYRRLWRKPELDPAYGETALATYNTLIQLYPTSKLVDTAKVEARDLEDWFAQKDYKTGVGYFRDEAYDSGLIYFRDILSRYPETPTARLAALRMVEAFRAIKYNEDAAELCTQMRERWASDEAVTKLCPAPKPAAPARADTTDRAPEPARRASAPAIPR